MSLQVEKERKGRGGILEEFPPAVETLHLAFLLSLHQVHLS